MGRVWVFGWGGSSKGGIEFVLMFRTRWRNFESSNRIVISDWLMCAHRNENLLESWSPSDRYLTLTLPMFLTSDDFGLPLWWMDSLHLPYICTKEALFTCFEEASFLSRGWIIGWYLSWSWSFPESRVDKFVYLPHSDRVVMWRTVLLIWSLYRLWILVPLYFL